MLLDINLYLKACYSQVLKETTKFVKLTPYKCILAKKEHHFTKAVIWLQLPILPELLELPVNQTQQQAKKQYEEHKCKPGAKQMIIKIAYASEVIFVGYITSVVSKKQMYQITVIARPQDLVTQLEQLVEAQSKNGAFQDVNIQEDPQLNAIKIKDVKSIYAEDPNNLQMLLNANACFLESNDVEHKIYLNNLNRARNTVAVTNNNFKVLGVHLQKPKSLKLVLEQSLTLSTYVYYNLLPLCPTEGQTFMPEAINLQLKFILNKFKQLYPYSFAETNIKVMPSKNADLLIDMQSEHTYVYKPYSLAFNKFDIYINYPCTYQHQLQLELTGDGYGQQQIVFKQKLDANQEDAKQYLAWQANKDYAVGDYIYHNFCFWRAKLNHTSYLPNLNLSAGQVPADDPSQTPELELELDSTCWEKCLPRAFYNPSQLKHIQAIANNHFLYQARAYVIELLVFNLSLTHLNTSTDFQLHYLGNNVTGRIISYRVYFTYKRTLVYVRLAISGKVKVTNLSSLENEVLDYTPLTAKSCFKLEINNYKRNITNTVRNLKETMTIKEALEQSKPQVSLTLNKALQSEVVYIKQQRSY